MFVSRVGKAVNLDALAADIIVPLVTTAGVRWCGWHAFRRGLATNFTNEGEATAHYVAEMLRARKLRVSRIARGVPLGGELEYVDAGTISQALLERREI